MSLRIPDRQSMPDSVGTGLLGILQQSGTPRVHVHNYSAQNVPSLREAKHQSSFLRAERALVMAQRGDVVLLNQLPDTHFLDYLDELNIGTGRDSIIAPDEGSETLAELSVDPIFADLVAGLVAEKIPTRVEPCITTYFPATDLQHFKSALEAQLGLSVKVESGSHLSAVLANSKDRMRIETQRLGIPIAPGEIVSVKAGQNAADVVLHAAERNLVSTGAVIIRGAWSSSGADVRILKQPIDHDSLKVWFDKRPHLRSYLVETLLPITSSPNFQLWIDGSGSISTIGVTGQRLREDSSHCGNFYPYNSQSLASMQAAVLRIAAVLADHGFQGPLGVDMMEYPDSETGKNRFAFAEINGRMNASTYVFALQEGVNRQRLVQHRASIDAWVSHTDTPVGVRDFTRLQERLGDLVYTHDRSAGVIAFNTGLLSCGMVDLLTLAGTVEQAREIEREALRRLAGA